MREENFLQNSSNDLWVRYPDDFTSMGTILFPLDKRKSIS